MSLVKWSDRTFPRFNSAFDNFFNDDNGFISALSKGTSMPAVNTSETKDDFIVEVAAPGMDKNDFKVELDNNVLTISSEKEDSTEDNEKNYTRKEYNYSSFFRSFRLPDNVKPDKIKANYKDGVLQVTLPKAEPVEPETKSIAVA